MSSSSSSSSSAAASSLFDEFDEDETSSVTAAEYDDEEGFLDMYHVPLVNGLGNARLEEDQFQSYPTQVQEHSVYLFIHDNELWRYIRSGSSTDPLELSTFACSGVSLSGVDEHGRRTGKISVQYVDHTNESCPSFEMPYRRSGEELTALDDMSGQRLPQSYWERIFLYLTITDLQPFLTLDVAKRIHHTIYRARKIHDPHSSEVKRCYATYHIEPSPLHVRKVFTAVKWRDQGWGNYKGRLIYEYYDEDENLIFHCEPFAKAEHTARVDCVYLPNPEEILEKCAQIQIHGVTGGGGGHQLLIQRLEFKIEYYTPSRIRRTSVSLFSFLGSRHYGARALITAFLGDSSFINALPDPDCYTIWPGDTFTWQDAAYHSDFRHFTSFDLNPFHQKITALFLVVVWKDQGWGNRKGEIKVQYCDQNSSFPFELENVFGFAEHYTSKRITRLPHVDLLNHTDHLNFLARAGGGGGHSLFIYKCFAIVVHRH